MQNIDNRELMKMLKDIQALMDQYTNVNDLADQIQQAKFMETL